MEKFTFSKRSPHPLTPSHGGELRIKREKGKMRRFVSSVGVDVNSPYQT
ncbi:MAG: hypothetical protein LBP62_00530 [Clostridiales bacterium]|nr:hypothetical protein [Clostridiales bacterium]